MAESMMPKPLDSLSPTSKEPVADPKNLSEVVLAVSNLSVVDQKSLANAISLTGDYLAAEDIEDLMASDDTLATTLLSRKYLLQDDHPLNSAYVDGVLRNEGYLEGLESERAEDPIKWSDEKFIYKQRLLTWLIVFENYDFILETQ